MYQTFRELQQQRPSQIQRKKPPVKSLKATPPAARPNEPPILEMTPDGEFEIPEPGPKIASSDDAPDRKWAASDTESEADDSDNQDDEANQPWIDDNDRDIDEGVTYLPPPRQTDQVSKIVFTPRVFPTPSRESTAAAQDISETDPRGDDFYRHKDFQSAINAYGDALAIDPSFTPYAHRQRHDRACPTERHASSKLASTSQAKADYGVALTFHPQSEPLQLDFARIGQLEACAEQKKQADACYTNQDFVAARELYSQALTLDPTFISYALQWSAALDEVTCVRNQDSRRQWVLKTLVRRGAAYTIDKQWAKAEQDYLDGLILDPGNAQLTDDLAHVRRMKREAP
ncbi:hypothetical protein DYB32_002960 [Aphanomyces invadans]|uniref:TPR-like protein n=1 Tax=Aphanomyces invadans TaxID=157072 RepID=A0A3R6Z1W6_9STRA|nr:hypothetical protein DYB32_002960 [Aphanomyces invadans]